MIQNNLKNIFENINEGSVLAFYQKKWYLQLIPFFTREIKKEFAPQHCGICYEIKRRQNEVHFMLSEQSLSGGRYRGISIIKKNDVYVITDKYFKKQNEIRMFNVIMNFQQVNKGILDAKKQIGKKYGFTKLLLGFEFLEKVIPKFIFKRINKKEGLRVCSTHIAYNLKHAGFSMPDNDFLTPLEITKLDIYV